MKLTRPFLMIVLVHLLALGVLPAHAAPSAAFMRYLNAYLSGSRVAFIVDDYKYVGHKIEGDIVIFTYQDRTLGRAGKAAQQKAAGKILKVICTGKIKSGAARNDTKFAMVITSWTNKPQSTHKINLTSCD